VARYSRTTAYRISRIERTRVYLSGTTVLGKGQVDRISDAGALVTSIPHEYARSVKNKDSGFFQGKLIRAASGASAHVKSIGYGQPMTLFVDSASEFHPGETFHYYDLQPGDTFEIPLTWQQ
jgi:hypothetical protein